MPRVERVGVAELTGAEQRRESDVRELDQVDPDAPPVTIAVPPLNPPGSVRRSLFHAREVFAAPEGRRPHAVSERAAFGGAGGGASPAGLAASRKGHPRCFISNRTYRRNETPK